MPLSPLVLSRRAALAATGLVALAAATPMLAKETLAPGQPAPAFEAQDATGKTVRLTDFKGRTVVIEWTNQDCPYVRKHYETGTMQALQKAATGDGVVWLTVASSAPGQQGWVDGPMAQKLTADRKASPSAFLLDPEGRIGHAFGATVTPHMFVIDKDGRIAYMGGIDDKPTANHADVKTARPHVREALAAVAAGKAVSPASTRPYGCTIKYKGA